jgi:starch phosphorylase
LNFSVLDGCWDEAYHSGVGWAIDPVDEVSNRQHQDELDFENMMNTLEHQIVPLYYERDENGIPRGWLQVAKNSVIEIGPLFSTHRMLRDYYSEMYYPTAVRGQQLLANHGKKLRVLTRWKQMVATHFSGVEILKVDIEGLNGDQVSVGQEVVVNIQVKSPHLRSEEIQVEFVYGLRSGDGFAGQPAALVLECQDLDQNTNVLQYYGKVLVESPGSYVFSVRVVPVHPLLAVPQETGLMCWG